MYNIKDYKVIIFNEKYYFNRFTEENKRKRPDCTFLPFGLGPRNCLGIRLALLEAKIAIVYMLQNFSFTVHEKTEVRNMCIAAIN